MEFIRLEDVHKTYSLGEVEVPVLHGISLSIARGEMVALMGASGSGKTTLMNVLGCLDHPSAGKYWLDGQEMSGLSPNQRAMVRTEKIGFVFQNFNLLPRTTALQNVVMPLDYAPRQTPTADARRWGWTLLERVGLADRAGHEPSQLSGGEQQRVAIGRALANHPALVLADEPTGNLDSHTGIEILRMFQQLNAEGITVVLVTHDPQVAAYAHRTVHIVDGMIEDGARETSAGWMPAPHADGLRGGGASAVAASQASAAVALALKCKTAAIGCAEGRGDSSTVTPTSLTVAPTSECKAATIGRGAAVKPRRRWTMPELVPHTWRTALDALRRNKMRSALSVLGVIIAVGAVIAMMEIGQGSKTTLQKSIASMGANILMIQSGVASSGGVTHGAGSALKLTPQDAEEIVRQCPAVSEVAPVVRTRSQVVYGNRNWVPLSIRGTTPSYVAVRDWEDLQEGEMFTDRDVRNGSKVCVIGETIRRELLQDESVVGKHIRVRNVLLRVIGVLSRKGANMIGMDQDDVILMPWTTVRYRLSGKYLAKVNQSAATASDTSGQVNTLSNLYPGSTKRYSTRSAAQLANTPQPVRFATVHRIFAKAVSEAEVPQAINQITGLLRERHRIQPGEADDFYIRDMAELMEMLSSTSRLMSGLLLAVALISLVVGGVGIMNIMLVSVTERTREIGLRMAVGARSHHILRQFLVEAVVLCLCGGGLGILLGRGTSVLVRSIMHWPTEASLSAIVAAVAVSATVGIAFGFYPAWKASRLDPIEALRYE